MKISSRTFKKIINKFLDIVKIKDIRVDKLGGDGILVEVDETSLHRKEKSHRGRAPQNKTDALCIVEVEDRITRAYACVIPDKKATTMIPIIQDIVAAGSIVWTDEHKS